MTRVTTAYRHLPSQSGRASAPTEGVALWPGCVFLPCSSWKNRRQAARGACESLRWKIIRRVSLWVFLMGTATAHAQECVRSSAGQSAPVRSLYVVAGQSNAAGLATVNDFVSGKDDVADKNTIYKNVAIYGIRGAPAGVLGADEGVGSKNVDWSRYATWQTASPGFGFKNSAASLRIFPFGSKPLDFFGPELSLASLLNNRPPRDHYLVKLAVANTALYPDASFKHWHPSGSLYAELLQMIADAHNSKNGIVQLKVAGVFFMQGETDALIEVWAKEYQKNILNFVQSLRQDVKRMGCADILDFPVVIGRIQNNDAWTYREHIRTAQNRLPKFLKNVAIVDTDDFAEHLVAGGVHFDEYAQFQLGKRVYWAFDKLSSDMNAARFGPKRKLVQKDIFPIVERVCGSYCGGENGKGQLSLKNALPVTYRYDGVCHSVSCAAPYGRSN